MDGDFYHKLYCPYCSNPVKFEKEDRIKNYIECSNCSKKIFRINKINIKKIIRWTDQINGVGKRHIKTLMNAADIKRIREKTGITTKELSKVFYLECNAFDKFENSLTILTDKYIMRMLRFLDAVDDKKEIQRRLGVVGISISEKRIWRQKGRHNIHV